MTAPRTPASGEASRPSPTDPVARPRRLGRATGGPPRVVLVTRATEYDELVARHGTHGQAEFFLRQRGLSIEVVQECHRRFQDALQAVTAPIPLRWRRARVERADLDRFVVEPQALVVAVGQDGLVANVAKYLEGQAVIGVNPDPERYDGVLVPHPPAAAPKLLRACAADRFEAERRTMVEAVLDDGQRLVALNEIFAGHRSHQSARYRIAWEDREERHSSSGLIVATGTGATGWALSIDRQRHRRLPLPKPEDPRLAFFVREPFPSVATGTSVSEGVISHDAALKVTSEMNEGGVVFGDGIEADRLDFAWGRCAEIRQAEKTLCLVRG